MKYIRTKHFFMIFSNTLVHADVARACNMKREAIVGAGFIQSDGETIVCYGKSISLGIEGDKDADTQAARNELLQG